MLVGATLKKEEISYWEPKLVGNSIMRVFPSPTDGIPAAASDTRYAYCKRVGAIPFISGKVNGDTAKIGSSADARTKRTFRNVIMDLIDAGFPMVYCTDHHEPEGDATSTFTAAKFIANFNALMAMVNALPSTYRAKVKCGPVMTKQWTENTAGRSYATWDPGTGDFYAIDCYLNTWSPSDSSKVFTSYPSPAAWLSTIKGYRKSTGDTRPRIFAELGAIQPPWDTDGSARAAWIKAVYAELATWTTSTTAGWSFLGAIWWDAQGTGGASLDTVGTHRWFQLDRVHNGQPYTDPSTGVVDGQGNYDVLPPVAKPVAAYNTVWQTYASGVAPPSGTTQVVYPTGTVGTARVGTPTVTNGPVTGGGNNTPPPVVTPVARTGARPPALSSVGAFTVTITDATFRAIAPPLVWQNLDVTVKRNAVGSGVVQLRPTPAVVAALNQPDCRVCVVRNPAPAAGIPVGYVLMSGPVEKPGQYRWSVDDDPVGALKVQFASNELYLAERLTYPDPGNAANAQTVSTFVINGLVAETALRQLVNMNIGPGALAARRHPLVVIGALSGPVAAGTAVTYSTRLEALTDALRNVALAGGDLTWRLRDTGTTLSFEVYPGQVRNGAVFSRQRGNLRTVDTDPSAPQATVAVVGGSGTGASRALYEVAPVTEWRRMEAFVNQSSTSVTAELTTAAATELADKGAKAGLTATAVDPGGVGYGARYQIGDLVPVEDAGGLLRTDRVTAVRVQADAGGPITYTPTIGGDSDITDPATLRLLRDLLRRVAKTERT